MWIYKRRLRRARFQVECYIATNKTIEFGANVFAVPIGSLFKIANSIQLVCLLHANIDAPQNKWKQNIVYGLNVALTYLLLELHCYCVDLYFSFRACECVCLLWSCCVSLSCSAVSSKIEIQYCLYKSQINYGSVRYFKRTKLERINYDIKPWSMKNLIFNCVFKRKMYLLQQTFVKPRCAFLIMLMSFFSVFIFVQVDFFRIVLYRIGYFKCVWFVSLFFLHLSPWITFSSMMTQFHCLSFWNVEILKICALITANILNDFYFCWYAFSFESTHFSELIECFECCFLQLDQVQLLRFLCLTNFYTENGI